VVADLHKMDEGRGTLSLYLNHEGGIMDDVIINKTEDHLYVVSNAGCSDKITKHLNNHMKDWKDKDVALEFIDNGLIALQGPLSHEVITRGSNLDVAGMSFMQSRVGVNLFGVEGCTVVRCGYTGEDGFEISVPRNKAVELADKLLGNDQVELAGLGARDSLRLEAGLCLYGNDMDETKTPVEASLLWCVAKSRRQRRDFPGADKVLQQLKDKPKTKRVGLVVEKGIARSGAVVVDESGCEVGEITSGCPSPSSGKNIAMAYIPTQLSQIGTNVGVKVRKRVLQARVVRMPFVPANHYFAK